MNHPAQHGPNVVYCCRSLFGPLAFLFHPAVAPSYQLHLLSVVLCSASAIATPADCETLPWQPWSFARASGFLSILPTRRTSLASALRFLPVFAHSAGCWVVVPSEGNHNTTNNKVLPRNLTQCAAQFPCAFWHAAMPASVLPSASWASCDSVLQPALVVFAPHLL